MFVTTLMLHALVVILHLIMLVRTLKIRYTRIFNPILLILPLVIGYFLVGRLGVLTEYIYPRYPCPYSASSRTLVPSASSSRPSTTWPSWAWFPRSCSCWSS